MNSNFTFRTYSFFATIFILALSLNLKAQTSHDVTASGSSFSPSNLTITVGDEVVWTNSNGSHNVDGLISKFPSNPESFGNAVGTGWIYKFTFNTAGTYDYQCDILGPMGMTGKITVNPKTVTSNQTLADGTGKILLYPNPASKYVQILFPGNYDAVNSIKIYNITGSVVDEKTFSDNQESLLYDISQFKNGVYFMEISAGNQQNVLKFIKQ